MHYVVCIDDTDMPGTKGTGWLAQELGERMTQNGLGTISAITRHQLFVHEDVPYTSHNSSMCFELSLNGESIDPVINFMADFLFQRSQKGSDPGLCVLPAGNGVDYSAVIDYGYQAKRKVLTKQSAYDLASVFGIHLSEHGGTGQGVVGALAGAGLRLSGNDGRYRGWYHLGLPGEVVSLRRLSQYDFIEDFVTLNSESLEGQTHVMIGSKKNKTVRIGHKQVLVFIENENKESGVGFRTITKKEAKQY